MKLNKRSRAYWEGRALLRERYYQSKSEIPIQQVQAYYDKAFKSIEKEIKSAVKQLADKGGLDSEDAGAYLARLTRLEQLQNSIYSEFSELANIEERITENHYRALLQDSYARHMYDIQKGLGVGFTFTAIPKRSIDFILGSKFKGGFSGRVWKNTAILSTRLDEALVSMFASGSTLREAVNDFVSSDLSLMKEKGRFNAERLIRTEYNYVANQGELMAYNEIGIEKYRYLATLDNRTSELCQNLDKEVFFVSDAIVGENYPPMHPFCRSTTVIVLEGEDLSEIKQRARDPATGKTFLVPASMNYREWKEKYLLKNKPDGATIKYKSFKSLDHLEGHYSKHKKDYPGLTTKKYQSKGVSLLNAKPSKNILSFYAANGDIYKYNRSTNDFVVGSKEGYVKTLYKPKSGYQYWLRKVNDNLE